MARTVSRQNRKAASDRITSTHYIEELLRGQSRRPIGTKCAGLGTEGAREKVGNDRREDDPQPVSRRGVDSSRAARTNVSGNKVLTLLGGQAQELKRSRIG